MRLNFTKPRLFLSYAREDSAFAGVVYRSLTAAGFEIYFDVEKTLAGERFLSVIAAELRRCDGVVAVVSEHSAASVWCQAELYYAHAMRKPIAPLRLGSEQIRLAEPLAVFQEPLQYIFVRDEADYPRASALLHRQLEVSRRRARSRALARIGLAAAVVLLSVFGWREGISRLNDSSRSRDRASAVDRVRSSAATLTRDTVSAIASRLPDDSQLAGNLLAMVQDHSLTDTQRINALVLSDALMLPRIPRSRWAIRGLDWAHSDLARTSLTDLTFMTGRMDDVRFTDVAFAGISWNEAPSQGKEGLMLSNVVFDTCRFYSNWFRGSGGIALDFRNPRFRGTWIDVQGFGAVRFRSHQREPDRGLITDEIGIFENSVLTNCVPGPAPGVLEIVPEGSEVQFDGVMFETSRLRGRMRPQWFRKCHFRRCVLPKALAREVLVNNGNTVEDCVWQDEECAW